MMTVLRPRRLLIYGYSGLQKMLIDLDWRVEETGDLNFEDSRSGDPVMAAEFGNCRQSFAGTYDISVSD